MAVERRIGNVTVIQQNILLTLLWSLVTFGIYDLWWIYRANRELRDAGGALGDAQLGASSPGLSFLAFFPGALIVIPPFVSMHNTGRRIQALQRAAGRPDGYSMVLHWMLFLFTGLRFLYAQWTLNEVWENAAAAPGSSQQSPIVTH